MIVEGITDEEGWMYARRWKGSWRAQRSFGMFVRRRLWIRKMKIIDSQTE
jgi:hypothetical protein